MNPSAGANEKRNQERGVRFVSRGATLGHRDTESVLLDNAQQAALT